MSTKSHHRPPPQQVVEQCLLLEGERGEIFLASKYFGLMRKFSFFFFQFILNTSTIKQVLKHYEIKIKIIVICYVVGRMNTDLII